MVNETDERSAKTSDYLSVGVWPTVAVSVPYFERSLSTGAAVLAAKHQQGLHTENRVLLQLNQVWRREAQNKRKSIQGSALWLKIVGHILDSPLSGQEITMFESTMTPCEATARLLW